MERRDIILPLAIVFLGLTLLINGYWVSRAVDRGSQWNANGLSNLGISLSNSMSRPLNQGTDIKDKEILTLQEVENLLGISGDQGYRIMDEIPHILVGNQILYSKRSIIEWVEKSNYGIKHQ